VAKWLCRDAILAFMRLGCVGGLVGCDSKTTTQTEVKGKLFGGTEVKETTVTEQGDKTQVKETKTEIKPDGTLDKKETTVKGDNLK
jgi:hypothetical protein